MTRDPSHGSKGSPPTKVKDFIKEKGWDWDKKQEKYNSSQNNTTNTQPNTSNDTVKKSIQHGVNTAIAIGIAYGMWTFAKWAFAAVAAPMTGGASMGAAAVIP